MSKEKYVPKYDRSALSDVEELLVLKQHRARPHGEKECKIFFPGDKYKQSGLDKAQVIMTDQATLDLKAVVPENKKRKAPKPGEEKHLSPTDVLGSKIDKLVDVIADLVNNKKK